MFNFKYTILVIAKSYFVRLHSLPPLDRNAFEIKYFWNHFQVVQVMPGSDDIMMRNQVVHKMIAIRNTNNRTI